MRRALAAAGAHTSPMTSSDVQLGTQQRLLEAVGEHSGLPVLETVGASDLAGLEVPAGGEEGQPLSLQALRLVPSPQTAGLEP